MMSESEEEDRVEFDVALNNARQSNDRRVKAQLETLKKWTRTYRNAKKTRDTFTKYISPLDSAVEFHVHVHFHVHVAQYAISVWDKHREKHKEIFANIEDTETQLVIASRAITRIKRRLAARHGWVADE